MGRIICDGSYKEDLREYTEQILEKYGTSSPTAERETMYMADSGNTVATKLYADMIFYKKILRRKPYRDAFELYMRAADIDVDDSGNWHFGERAYPLAFRTVGYYLLNYRRDSFLLKCEKINVLENMDLQGRLWTALELAVSCVEEVKSAGAVNLLARILHEASENEILFYKLLPGIRDLVADRTFVNAGVTTGPCESMEECSAMSELFFKASAKDGYIYACNSLAAREASRIIDLNESGADEAEIQKCAEAYVEYLKLAADRYEPYAANRLGLFCITGEIRSGEKKVTCKSFIDPDLAREYFKKATVYPDSHSAWAYLNLIKYFRKDYGTDLDLMNEHMDYIKELDPSVYDIAMEL